METFAVSCPPMVTLPESGISRPAITRSSVVLPEPDGPSRATSSPRRIRRSTPSSAGCAPKPLRTPMTSISSARPSVAMAGRKGVAIAPFEARFDDDARIEDVLDLYAQEPDPKRPVVCFDESPTQLIGEVREPIPAAPGQPERYDREYRRNGTANLFVFLDAHQSWPHVKATDQRTAHDFALCMGSLDGGHHPD